MAASRLLHPFPHSGMVSGRQDVHCSRASSRCMGLLSTAPCISAREKTQEEKSKTEEEIGGKALCLKEMRAALWVQITGRGGILQQRTAAPAAEGCEGRAASCSSFSYKTAIDSNGTFCISSGLCLRSCTIVQWRQNPEGTPGLAASLGRCPVPGTSPS